MFETTFSSSLKLLFLVSFNFFIIEKGSSQRTWYVGINIIPSIYELYNKNDWNADRTIIYPVTGKVNSITIGTTTMYTWGKHFGFSSGLLYNRCRQEFLEERDPNDPDPLVYYSITNDFNYLKLPLNFEYSTNNNAKHQFVASAGLQTSFLLSYKEHFSQRSTGFYSEAEYKNKRGIAISPGGTDINYTAFLYTRFLMGLTSSVAYRLKFKDGWLFQIGIRGEYDLSNVENRSAKNVANNAPFWSSGIKRYGYGGPIENRPKTHNRAVGVFIGASIPVSVR